MKHPFKASQLDKKICVTCQRDVFAHLNKAECESCGNKTGPCDLFDNILMCTKCEDEYKNNIISSAKTIEDNVTSLLERAKDLDKKIITNADIFNAQTISHAQVKQEIDNDASLTPTEKSAKYQQFLNERFDTFQKAIFERDNEIHKLTLAKNEDEHRQLAVIKDFRALGNEIRSEYREKLRVADMNYAPIKPPNAKKEVKPKVSMDPFERMAMNYVTVQAHKNISITLDEAKEILRKNMKG
jgi:hypothetical protein